MAAEKGVKTIFTEAGSIADFALFSIQETGSNDLDNLDFAIIVKESKRTESACCAISGKSFAKENVLTASVPQKPIALSSAVCMNIDQRALENDSVGHSYDIPRYRILHKFPSTSLEVRCCEKNNTPSSTMTVVDDIDKRSNSSDDRENVYNGIQNVETTSSDNVGDHEVNRDDTLTSRFVE